MLKLYEASHPADAGFVYVQVPETEVIQHGMKYAVGKAAWEHLRATKPHVVRLLERRFGVHKVLYEFIRCINVREINPDAALEKYKTINRQSSGTF